MMGESRFKGGQVLALVCVFCLCLQVYRFNAMHAPLTDLVHDNSDTDLVQDNLGNDVSKEESGSDRLNGMPMHVGKGVLSALHMLDSAADTFGLDKNTDSLKAMKSMLILWNREASRWATLASHKYKQALKNNDKLGPMPTMSTDNRIEIKQFLEQCNCSRIIKGFERRNEGNESTSTCSLHSVQRGPGQRVIGFSFYGNPESKLGSERKYFEGIKENLELLPKYYPSWNIRLYYDLAESHPLMSSLCDLACSDPNIDLCMIKRIPSSGDLSKIFAMNWRFLPLLDPQVTHFASRDLDSRLNYREASAVQEWLHNSSKAFHFMRDHPAHSIEILGSGWGMRLRSIERQMVKETFEAGAKDPLFWAPRKSYGPDQGLLKRYFWPWAKWNALSHDSYTCATFPRTSPFPTERKLEPNNFVASVVSANDVMRLECPVKCRPKLHQDWKLC